MKIKVTHQIITTEEIEIDDKYEPLIWWAGDTLDYYDLVDEFIYLMRQKFGEVDYIEDENGN